MAKHIKSLIQVSKCICCILRGIGYEDLSVVVSQLFFLFPIMNVMMRLVSVLAFSHVGVLWFCQLQPVSLCVSGKFSFEEVQLQWLNIWRKC